jgi:predicted aldo/keto reductase-like oxidoreductase
MVILSGMSTYEQVVDNISYMKDPKPLTPEEHMVVQKVVGIMNQKSLIECTKCNYCIDGCPQNISIPKYFNLYNQMKLTNGTNIEVIREEYENLKANGGAPKDCISCLACESVCPQHLSITKYLKDIGWTFDK